MNHYIDDKIKLNNTAVALGKFDGVHEGHLLLIDTILRLQNQGFNGVVFTFDMKPNSVFNIADVKNIYTREEKYNVIKNLGVDNLVEYPFTDAFAAMDPVDFIKDILIGKLDAKYIVVGNDYRFGKKRAGNIELLKQYEEIFGYQLIAIPKKIIGDTVVSSTDIRRLITEGHVKEVALRLGRAYSLYGKVVYGRQLGRTIDIPTANILPAKQKLYPPFGVYASKVYIDGEDEAYLGITNIGDNPTVNDKGNITIETHIYDFNRDIYGSYIRIELLEFIRPEMKFSSIEELKTQMQKDIERCISYENGSCT